jgi:hypothetical protein
MRRAWIAALLLVLLIAGCGGPPPDTTVGDPPKSSAFEKSDNEKVNQLVDRWKSEVPAEMKKGGVKDTPEQPIEQKVYQSTASLQEIGDFYKGLTSKDWHEDQKMPGIQDGVLITGYEIGNTTLVISAVDTSQFGGNGVVIYTAKGTK